MEVHQFILNVHLGWVNMSPYIFFGLSNKVDLIFSPNVEVVDQILFQFAICRSIPQIFAIKVESYQKSRRILDVFSPSEILGGRPSKSYTHIITPASRYVLWKKFCEDTPTSLEVIWAHTLNFKPKFTFSLLFFFVGGEGTLPVRCALARFGQSVAHVKISGRSTG